MNELTPNKPVATDDLKLLVRLISSRQGVNNDLRYYQVLTFQEGTRLCTASIYRDFLKLPKLKAGEWLEVTVHHAIRHDAKHYILTGLRHLSATPDRNGAASYHRYVCPYTAREAHDDLVVLNETLTRPELRSFVTQVLLDPAIGKPFLNTKASQKHHHAYAGGLLVHSLEVVREARKLGEGRLTQSASELVAVAALFHDIGKLWTVGSNERPNLGRFVRHEMLTAAVLARHLEQLRKAWPEGAEALLYLWDFQSRPPRDRGFAKFIGADFLVWADQLSASSFHGRGLEALHG